MHVTRMDEKVGVISEFKQVSLKESLDENEWQYWPMKKENQERDKPKKVVKKGRKEQHLPDSCLQTVAEHRDSR